MQYQIKRAAAVLATVTPTGKRNKKIMDANMLDITFSLSISVDFTIGDYITAFGERYVIQDEPNMRKLASNNFEYSIQFKGQSYELFKADLFFPDAANALTEPDFSIMGTCDVVIDLVLRNANRLNNVWVKGTIDVTQADNHTFSGSNCLAALAQLADTYKLEWWVNGTTINMTKVGVVQPLTFQYGQGKGLYDIARTTSNDKSVVTRLYPFGSSDNIPGSYRNYSKRLKLPAPDYYIEMNTDKYGIIENVQYFDDIKPEYIGTITSVTDIFNFSDTGIDFNIHDQQLPSVKPQVTFLTGQLAGYSFEVGNWTQATKTVNILKNTSEKAIDLPSALLHPQVGDTYTFLQINMPGSYISAAELRLQARAAEYLSENSNPNVVYSVTPSVLYFKQNSITLNIGDYIKIVDTDFNLNKNIRITGFTQNVQEPAEYTIDLQEVVNISQIVRNYNAYKEIKSSVSLNKLSDINRTRMNWKTTQQLRSMIYDPDGNYFDPTNIKPQSIETLMLSVGSKAQQLLISGVIIEANFQSDASKVNISAGQLTQFTIADNPLTWNIAATSVTGLAVGAYYIYAKCSKTTTGATIIFSTATIKTEDIAGYYVFWIGTLSSVIDGVRGISLTFGQSTINGRFIKTGDISSFDGLTGFDLDLGIIYGKIQFGTEGGSTIVDGKLLTSTTIIMGDPDTGDQWASLTGDVDYLSPGVVNPASIVLAIGKPFANKATAPFRVTADGHLYSVLGMLGNYTIDSKGLKNTDNIDAYIIQRKTVSGSTIVEASIGTDIDDNGYIGVFKNKSSEGVANNGVKIEVVNGTSGPPISGNFSGNLALDLTGDVWLKGGNLVLGATGEYKGITTNIVYRGGEGEDRHMTLVDGIIVHEGSGAGP